MAESAGLHGWNASSSSKEHAAVLMSLHSGDRFPDREAYA